MAKGTGCAARPLLPARKLPLAAGRQVAHLEVRLRGSAMDASARIGRVTDPEGNRVELWQPA
jgi:hypothetical protein